MAVHTFFSAITASTAVNTEQGAVSSSPTQGEFSHGKYDNSGLMKNDVMRALTYKIHNNTNLATDCVILGYWQ